jgi:hypothetical protein
MTREKRKYSKKTYPNATLLATNPTQTDLGLNPGLSGANIVVGVWILFEVSF